MPKIHYSLDDIAIVPADFSNVKSRKDVDTTQEICGYKFTTPVISSNMSTVYSPELAIETAKNGAVSTVHRFCTIEENVALFQDGIYEDIKPWVSIGLGSHELDRAGALVSAGASVLVIDVANGASQAVVDQFKAVKSLFKVQVVVGNFSTKGQIQTFVEKANNLPDLIKLGQGNGSACLTSIRTGIAYPAVNCIDECASIGIPVIYDGGVKDSGDLCKMIALGAKGAMVGRLFAATLESPAPYFDSTKKSKIYKGSASQSSYQDQGKSSSFRAPEGDIYPIPVTGTVEDLIHLLNGGLRSSMSYSNSFNINEFRENVKFILISSHSAYQQQAFGKYVK